MTGIRELVIKTARRRELKQAEKLRVFDDFSKEQVHQLQLRKLNALSGHFRNFPFYRELLEQNNSPRSLSSLEDIKTLPVITKDVITENLSYLGDRPGAKMLDSTSGSTGRNFQFYKDNQTLQARRAAHNLQFEWMGINYLHDKKLTVWGHSPKSGKLKELLQSVKLSLLRVELIQAYGLDEQRCINILNEIHRYKPALLTAYPGYAYDLACAGQKHNIKPPQVRAIVLSGEKVFEHQKKAVEKYFNSRVFNRYGSREFGCIAHQCEYQRNLHVHPSRIYLEQDENSELLVTDLDNFATPFIRYAIGDAGRVVESECPCGRNFQSLAELKGRSHDIIATKSGRQLPGQFWTTLSRSVPGIKEFQVVQISDDEVELRIIAGPGYKDENECELHQNVHKFVGDEIKLKMVKVSHIELTPSGKRRFVIKMNHQQ